MKSLMTATALAALVAASPAFGQAQDMQDPSMTTPPAVEPAPDAMPPADSAPGMTTPPADSAPSAPETVTPPSDSTTLPDSAAAPSAPTELFVTQQAAEDTLASSMIGANVENTAGEDLGSISDIVLNDEGSVDAVVIGVGGFLGIGEKNVGVSFDAIEASTDADGNVVLTLDATREQLEGAPAFVTVAEQRQEQEMNAPAASDPMAPAPAPAQ